MISKMRNLKKLNLSKNNFGLIKEKFTGNYDAIKSQLIVSGVDIFLEIFQKRTFTNQDQSMQYSNISSKT